MVVGQPFPGTAQTQHGLLQQTTFAARSYPLPRRSDMEKLGTDADFHFEWLPLSQLKVDHDNYQRPLDQKRINDFAESFNPLLFGIPLINWRDTPGGGECYVVDGQHRVEALRVYRMREGNRKDILVFCRVMFFKSSKEESYYYALFNGKQRPLTHGDVLKARVHHDDPVAVAIRRAVDAAGVDISYRNNGPQTDKVRATVALEKLYNMGGESLITTTLLTVRDIYPDDASAMSYKVLGAMGTFLRRYYNNPYFRLDRLREALAPVALTALLRKGTEIAVQRKHSVGGNAQAALTQAIIHYYNAGLSGKRKLDPNPPHPNQHNGKAKRDDA
jgi:hypothetical protein